MSTVVSSLRFITLPVPIKLQHRRGLRSLNSSGRAIAVRMHEDDLELLDKEAEALGVSRGELMRWVCAYAAAELHKLRTGEQVEIVP